MLYYIYSKRRKDGIIITEEIWKDVVGYEGYYQVSNMGRVKSLERKCKCCGNSTRTIRSKILKPGNDKGYLKVNLHKDNKTKQHTVHRLVAIAFLPNENNYPCVNHKDENPSNNNVSNLEWCSYEYNNNYGTTKERTSKTLKGRFAREKHPMYGKHQTEEAIRRMVEKKNKPVMCITTGDVFKSVKEASEITGINRSNIGQCCTNKRQSAGSLNGKKLEWKFLEKESEG